jgi:non-lysosomal glucosylceramidase
VRGRSALDALLWNGEYYEQAVDLALYPEHNWASGCRADQRLGQWWAYLLGLGELLPVDHVWAAAQSIIRHNYRHGFAGHSQQPRAFVTDDDQGLLNCTWPRGGRPAVPTPYSDEVGTGIEYEVAALLYAGEHDSAVRLVEAVRARYDGRKQSPWNDIECGGHYVRAMSASALLEAAAGFDYDAGAAALGFARARTPENFQAPFVTRAGWGGFRQTVSAGQQSARLQLAYGSLILRRLRLHAAGTLLSAHLSVEGENRPAVFSSDSADLGDGLRLTAGETLVMTLTLDLAALGQTHAHTP